MRAPSKRLLGLLLLGLGALADGPRPDPPTARPAVPLLDPTAAEFPEASLIEFGARREPRPDGFLGTDGEGHFVWPDGSRARFWGINVAAESVFQPFERIDTCVERIRRAGFDLVRIHHVDGTARGILVGDGETATFDTAKLEQLDYWIWSCGEAGLSVYLDLLDYREFLPGDGVERAGSLGRAAKPYAVFDRRLIELQKQYARALLRERVNRFSGLAYADDPTIVMLELFDEHGLFIRRGDWPNLVEPYRSRLTRLWNQFLSGRYGSTERLVAAWSAAGAGPPLAGHERIERGTVPLPRLALARDEPASDPREKLARAKAADAARFAAWVHRAYFREMKAYLREQLGVRVPLSAVGDGNILPDLQVVAEELDFTGTNWYWDHPLFRAGREWRLPFLFHYRNPLAATDGEAFGPKVSLARMHRTPLVVREWNPCFPNPHRPAGMVEAAAYAALQDIDAMILFTYGAVPTHQKLGYFDVHQDPTRWGLAGVLGELYRTRAVAPARRRIDLGYSAVDSYRFADYRTAVRDLAYVSRLANRLFADRLEADADLTLTSGRSSTGVYSAGPRLLFRNDPGLDTSGRVAIETPDHFGFPVGLVQGAAGSFAWDGSVLRAPGTEPRGPGGRFMLRDLAAAGARPLGVGGDEALGYVHLDQQVIGFGPLPPGDQARAALDALALFYGDDVGRDDYSAGRLRSDTGELLRDSGAGRMTIVAPRAVGVAGELAGTTILGDIRLSSATARGAALIVSLDGRPLAECEEFIARFLSDAQNRGMSVAPPGPTSNPRDRWVLTADGHGPPLTGGRPGERGWRVERGGRLWFAVGLSGGTFELVRDADGWGWFCDTPAVAVEVPGARRAVSVTAEGVESELPGAGRWLYPHGAAMVRAE